MMSGPGLRKEGIHITPPVLVLVPQTAVLYYPRPLLLSLSVLVLDSKDAAIADSYPLSLLIWDAGSTGSNHASGASNAIPTRDGEANAKATALPTPILFHPVPGPFFHDTESPDRSILQLIIIVVDITSFPYAITQMRDSSSSHKYDSVMIAHPERLQDT
ncbi:hypothetical protein Hypma_005090 [Hypsizygus marmoreus]|uniref:Uncharacterized protein n=1 Tax=Hypsizygus marmoreus TaxID=39966 RepID=A0A369K0I5_HYPMA|nr:hypothetical protein Hypma_005090 [Hypsizygus marmoreus]